MARTVASISPIGAVTEVGRKAVTPSFAMARLRASRASSVASMASYPMAP